MSSIKLNYILIGILVLAIAFLLFDNYYLDRHSIKTGVDSNEIDQVPVVSDVEESSKTIAVLPFVDLSPEKDQKNFVDGLSEELMNSLRRIPDLHILEGNVSKVGNSLQITAKLIREADNRQLWSKTYECELKDIFELQKDIAASVEDELKETLEIDNALK